MTGEQVKDQLLASRDVPPGPVAEARADAIALSLKTLLRSLAPAENGGAPPLRSSAPAENGGVSPGREPPPSAAPPTVPGAPLDVPSPLGRFRLEGDVGVRVGISNATPVEPRFALGLGWWPAPLRGWAGVAIRLDNGLGIPVDNHELSAHFDDHALSLYALGTALRLGRLSVHPELGAAVHFVNLEGSPIDGHQSSPRLVPLRSSRYGETAGDGS